MADEEALREAQRVSADAEALYAKVQQTRAQLDGLKTETRSMLTALTDREFQLQERLYELARLKLQGVAIDDQLQAKWELLNNESKRIRLQMASDKEVGELKSEQHAAFMIKVEKTLADMDRKLAEYRKQNELN